MTKPAIKIENLVRDTDSLAGFSGVAANDDQLSSPLIAQDVFFLAIVLAVLQVLDGVLTGIGIMHWGVGAEGNLIVRTIMEQLGFVPALVLVKSAALVVIALLCYLSKNVLWIGTALKAVIAIYLCAAIIPWTSLILTHLV